MAAVVERTAGASPALAAAAAAAVPPPLPFRLLPTAPTTWDPAAANVTLNVRLDGCIVPSEKQGGRIAYSHAVVLDDFVDDATRQQLLDFLLHGAGGANGTALGGDQPAARAAAEPAAPCSQQAEEDGQQAAGGTDASDVQLPPGRWERRTTDMAGAAPTWGVKQHVLQELAEGRLPAMQEVHARLAKLYPECDIAHLPSDAIQLQPPQPEAQQREQQPQQPEAQQGDAAGGQGGDGSPPAKRSRLDNAPADGSSEPRSGGAVEACGEEQGPPVDCACFVANAAVQGDTFRYHVDADPTSFPDGSPWHAAYGDYFNGEPGRPLLVSLLLYLNPEWRREWGADTLLLDGGTDTGIFVTPRPCRAVLFDQDIMHRVSAPLAPAGGRPRFSLVWKLALLPRRADQALCIARPEWGPPASFGSAAKVDAVLRRLAAERRAGTGPWAAQA